MALESFVLQNHQNLHHLRPLVFLSLLQIPQSHLLIFRMHSSFAHHFPLTVAPPQTHRIHYQIRPPTPKRPPTADLLQLVWLPRTLRSLLLPLLTKPSLNANLPLLILLWLAEVSHRSVRSHHPLRTSLIPWNLPKRPSPTKATMHLHHAHFNVQRHFPTSDLMYIEQDVALQSIRSYFPHLTLIVLLLQFRRIPAIDLRWPSEQPILLLLLVIDL